VQGSTFGILMNFGAKNPPLPQTITKRTFICNILFAMITLSKPLVLLPTSLLFFALLPTFSYNSLAVRTQANGGSFVDKAQTKAYIFFATNLLHFF
jgi:hypothetical protein